MCKTKNCHICNLKNFIPINVHSFTYLTFMKCVLGSFFRFQSTNIQTRQGCPSIFQRDYTPLCKVLGRQTFWVCWIYSTISTPPKVAQTSLVKKTQNMIQLYFMYLLIYIHYYFKLHICPSFCPITSVKSFHTYLQSDIT